MSLTNVFDNLSDAVLVVNHHGELTYFNSAASALISGTSVANIGIARLTDMLNLVLNEEISLPLRFKVFAGTTDQELSATITKIYSFYIVSLTGQQSGHEELTSESSRKQQESPLESLQRQLTQVSERLLNINDAAAQSSAPGSLQVETLAEQLEDMKIMLSMMLPSANQNLQAYSLSTLLSDALSRLHTKRMAKPFSIRIYEQPRPAAAVYCNADWLIRALSQCLLYVINSCSATQLIIVEIEYNPFFNSVRIATDMGQLSAVYEKHLVKELDIPADSENAAVLAVNANLSLALQIVHKLRGNIRLEQTDRGETLLLQLPSGELLNEDATLVAQQGKMYARELAELKSQLDKVRAL